LAQKTPILPLDGGGEEPSLSPQRTARTEWLDVGRGMEESALLGKLIYCLLLLLLIGTPLPYGSVEAWSTALWELLILLGLVLWSWRQLAERRPWLPRQPLLWPLCALLLVGLLQLLPLGGPTLGGGSVASLQTISYHPVATVQALSKLLAGAGLLLLLSEVVTTETRRDLLLHTLLLVCVAISLIGIGQNFIGKAFWQRGTFGPFVNRNHFAGFLVMGVGLTGGLLMGRGVRRELLALYGSGLLVLAAGIVLSASRGGVIALGATLLFLALVAGPLLLRRNASGRGGRGGRLAGVARSLVVLLLGLAAVAAALFLVGSEGLVQNLAQTGTELEGVQSAEERYSRREIWQASIEMVRDHPWLGVGLGAFPYVYPRYDPSAGTQRVEQTHNDYLQVLTDGGLVGGLLALLFLGLLFKRGLAVAQTRQHRHRSIVLGALAGCFAMAVHSFVDFNLQVTVNAQLFLTLAALATMRDPAESGNESTALPEERVALSASAGRPRRRRLLPGSSAGN